MPFYNVPTPHITLQCTLRYTENGAVLKKSILNCDAKLQAIQTLGYQHRIIGFVRHNIFGGVRGVLTSVHGRKETGLSATWLTVQAYRRMMIALAPERWSVFASWKSTVCHSASDLTGSFSHHRNTPRSQDEVGPFKLAGTSIHVTGNF